VAFWKCKSERVDRISYETLANFGRYEFLGSEQSGIDPSSAYSLIFNLNELIYPSSPPDRAQVIAESHRHTGNGQRITWPLLAAALVVP
jgi:hypothetical protein